MSLKNKRIHLAYKDRCLKFGADLKCIRYVSGSLSGFVVMRGTEQISSARSANEAWYKAWRRFMNDLKSSDELKVA